MDRFEIIGGADAETAAAIMAAVARVAEEQAAAAAVPPPRPAQGPWVLSTRPRPAPPAVAAREAPLSMGWSVGADDPDEG